MQQELLDDDAFSDDVYDKNKHCIMLITLTKEVVANSSCV